MSREDQARCELRGKPRLAVIVNPDAGPHANRARFDEIVSRLRLAGCELDIRQSSDAQSNGDLARAALGESRFDAVVAAGGDGTVRVTAKALAGTPMALGIIPVGTANVLAREIGLGFDARSVVTCLTDCRMTTVQTGRVNDELFLLMAGVGLDGRIVAGLDLPLKRRVGKLAYGPPLVQALRAGPDRLAVRIDGIEHTATWAIATLRRYYAGSFVISPDARLDDAGIHVVLFSASSRRALVGQILAVAAGRVGHHPGVTDIVGTTIEIVTPAPVPMQIDGEPFGTTPCRISARGPALRLLVPPQPASRQGGEVA
jgi:YegS/Rv2252/BmrU family lipid kinase